jgi:hypothetical protein
MIRVFQLFCKLNFKHLSAEYLFNKYMAEFKPVEHSCPWCNTKDPDRKKHAEYERWLISYEGGGTVAYRLVITRYKCPSCGHTHAILPESIIPYQSYSFLFIIAVMRDYYTIPYRREDLRQIWYLCFHFLLMEGAFPQAQENMVRPSGRRIYIIAGVSEFLVRRKPPV